MQQFKYRPYIRESGYAVRASERGALCLTYTERCNDLNSSIVTAASPLWQVTRLVTDGFVDEINYGTRRRLYAEVELLLNLGRLYSEVDPHILNFAAGDLLSCRVRDLKTLSGLAHVSLWGDVTKRKLHHELEETHPRLAEPECEMIPMIDLKVNSTGSLLCIDVCNYPADFVATPPRHPKGPGGQMVVFKSSKVWCPADECSEVSCESTVNALAWRHGTIIGTNGLLDWRVNSSVGTVTSVRLIISNLEALIESGHQLLMAAVLAPESVEPELLDEAVGLILRYRAVISFGGILHASWYRY